MLKRITCLRVEWKELVVWNQSWGEYLHFRNWQTQELAPQPLPQVLLKDLLAYHWENIWNRNKVIFHISLVCKSSRLLVALRDQAGYVILITWTLSQEPSFLSVLQEERGKELGLGVIAWLEKSAEEAPASLCSFRQLVNCHTCLYWLRRFIVRVANWSFAFNNVDKQKEYNLKKRVNLRMLHKIVVSVVEIEG